MTHVAGHPSNISPYVWDNFYDPTGKYVSIRIANKELEEQKVRIATFVNIMRKRKFGKDIPEEIGVSYDTEPYLKLSGQLQNLIKGIDLNPTTTISTVEIQKEFTLEDSDRLITQLMIDAGLNPNDQQGRARFAPKIFEDMVIDTESNTLTKVASPDYMYGDTSYLGESQNVLSQASNQLWNDSTILLDGELLATYINTGIQQGFIGKTLQEKKFISDKLKGVFEGDRLEINQISDEAQVNNLLTYLSEFWANKDSIRTYLATGNVLDQNGNIVKSNVPGWTESNAVASIQSLYEWEKQNPNRVITGESLTPEYGNTFTEQREKEISDKIRQWGWDQDESIKTNIDNILGTNNRDITDKLKYTDGDQRYAARHTRDFVVDSITAYMNNSLFDKGTKEYADEAVQELLTITGKNGEFSNYDNEYSKTLGRLDAVNWDVTTASGKDAAAEAFLDKIEIRKDQLTDEAFRELADSLTPDSAPSLGQLLLDESRVGYAKDQVEEKISKEAGEKAQKSIDDLNDPKSLASLVKSAMRNIGIITATTSTEFEGRLDSYTIPEIVRRITNAGGATNPEDVIGFVEQFTDKDILGSPGQLSALDVIESDFTRQYMTDSVIPPMAPGMSEFRQYREQTLAPIEEAEFDIASLSPELQTLAFERPEFAKFLSIQMSDPEYMKEFKELGTDRLKTTEEGEPLYKETLAEFGKRSAEAIQEAKEAKKYLEEVTTDSPAIDRQEEEARYAYEEAQKRADEAVRYTGPEFAKTLYETQRVKGMTTEEFFESKLPGFEQQFKGSAFEKAAEERKQREDEIEESRRRRDIARTSARTIVRGRQ